MRLPVDLRDHARLSLRFLTNSIDHARQGLPYFWIDFATTPPQLAHEMIFDDIENLGRWLYGLACAQRVAGSEAGEDTRQVMLREIDRRVAGPYGFPYSTGHTKERTGHKPFSWLWGNRSVLEGWIQSWRNAVQEEERSQLAARIGRMVEGLGAFVIWKGPYAFFPIYEPPLDWVKPADMRLPEDPDDSTWQQKYTDQATTEEGSLPLPTDSLGGMIWPLVEWCELTGDEKALELAQGLAHTVVQYQPLRSNPICPIGCFSNNHGVLNAIAGILACHRHVPNTRHLIWAIGLFEYYLNRCSSSFGWVTEYEQPPADQELERLAAEGCAVVDMVRVGIELGRCGFSPGWDVAERFTRNYLTQAQIRTVTPFTLPADLVINHPGRAAVVAVPESHRDSEAFWTRVVGALTGWGAPNDILDPRGRLALCIQNCCSSHLPIGLLHVWEHAVERHDNLLRIHLLLTQDGPLCRTTDHQPRTGLLEITPHGLADLEVRLPDWVEERTVRVTINGAPVAVTTPTRHRYLRIPAAPAESLVRVNYDLREMSLTERLAGESYTTRWRGDTVVGITPAGRFIPVF